MDGNLLSNFILSGMYAAYSFFAEYLESVTEMTGGMISLMLVLFGLTGVAGNLLAGKLITNHALKTVVVFPIILVFFISLCTC